MYNFIDFPRIDTKTTRQDFKKLGETAMLKTGNGHDSRNVYSPTGHDGAVKDVVLYKETLLTASGLGPLKFGIASTGRKLQPYLQVQKMTLRSFHAIVIIVVLPVIIVAIIIVLEIHFVIRRNVSIRRI